MKSRRIYNRINVLREDMGLTRKELAEKVGVNYQTIGYIEREEYNPGLDLAFRFSELFELPVELIFSTTPQKPLVEELSLKKYSGGKGSRTGKQRQ